MQRWHGQGCEKPHVEVLADQTPVCRNCRQSPRIPELAQNHTNSSSVPPIPEDKPTGHMDLWWPRSVPYSATSPAAPVSAPKKTEDLMTDDTKSSPKSYPYTSTLKGHEFRLICLEAADNYDFPLHLNLEVYALHDCPEYETVSYTWAGEDGDARLSSPIYIGPYWDVLFQTKNCWEMLRFIRPTRGLRMVWVDAVCINQSNTTERNTQVANMGHIYSACSRAIVYLGPDIAIPLHGRHPRRHRLHELESGAATPSFDGIKSSSPPPHQLKDLLDRRYFSRVWVIQELLLPQRVVIRVGDINFWADPVMATYFSSHLPGWKWNKTRASWVQRIAQGTSSVKNLGELLWLTSLSQATDPRDRVFGLLGIMPELSLLKHDSSETNQDLTSPSLPQRGLTPDYCLSCQHVFIGLFAYCFLNMRQTNILFHASCLSPKADRYPTWAPDWTSRTTWSILSMAPSITNQAVLNYIMQIIKGQTAFEIYEIKGPAAPLVTKERAWNNNASINCKTGALSINLTQVASLYNPLKRIGSIKGLHLFSMSADKLVLYLLSEKPLNTIIKVGLHELFILNIDDQSAIFLVLRASSCQDAFNLVAICPVVLIQTPGPSKSANEIPTLRNFTLEIFQHSLYDVLETIHYYIDEEFMIAGSIEDETLRRLLPRVFTGNDWLSLVYTVYAENKAGITEVTDNFKLLYLNSFSSEYHPGLQGDELTFLISDRMPIWDTYVQPGYWYRQNIIEEDRVWKYSTRHIREPREIWQPLETLASKYSAKHGSEQKIWIKMPLQKARDKLAEALHMSRSSKGLDKLTYTAKAMGMDAWSLLVKQLKHEDNFIGSPGFLLYTLYLDPDTLWSSLKTKGYTRLVSIL